MDPAHQEAFLRRVQEGTAPPRADVDPTIASLLAATEAGDLQAVRGLLETVAVDSVGDDDDTALHIASLYGKVEIVKELLARGASVNVRDEVPLPCPPAAVATRCPARAGGALCCECYRWWAAGLTWSWGASHRTTAPLCTAPPPGTTSRSRPC